MFSGTNKILRITRRQTHLHHQLSWANLCCRFFASGFVAEWDVLGIIDHIVAGNLLPVRYKSVCCFKNHSLIREWVKDRNSSRTCSQDQQETYRLLLCCSTCWCIEGWFHFHTPCSFQRTEKTNCAWSDFLYRSSIKGLKMKSNLLFWWCHRNLHWMWNMQNDRRWMTVCTTDPLESAERGWDLAQTPL